jgi:hypothetical protein
MTIPQSFIYFRRKFEHMHKSFFFVLAFLCLGSYSQGQNDSLSDIEFISVKQYQPILRAAKKIEIKADIEQNKAAKPDLAYSLPSFLYKVEPNYYPARAIGIKSGTYEPLYDNYFRIGAGNYLTPLVEARLHNTQNEKYSFGGYAKHLSANAGKPENADFSDNYIGINGNRYLKKGKLSGELDYERHVVHFYGYDQDSFDFGKDTINQIFNDFNGRIGFSTDRRKFQFNSNFDFYTFSNLDGRENDFMVTLNPVLKLPKKQRIDLGFAIDYTTLDLNGSTTLNRSFIRFNPVYYFHVKKINLKVGANVVYTPEEGKPKVYPDLYADLFLVPEKLKAFASFSGDLNKTNLRDLSHTNPFLNNSFEVRNTSTNVDVLAGLKGLLGNKFDYLLQLRYQVQNDLPLYVTDTSVLNTFGLVYDRINTLGFTVGAGLRVNEAFFMNVTGTFYNYDPLDEIEAWQLPKFDARINLRYTLAKKLMIRLQMYALGERIQFNPDPNLDVPPLNPFIDLNLHADYRYKENISFFVQVNNLTNARYQKWFNYPVLGLNALAGVTFSL